MARLAILGTGKIGESLLAGLLSSGWDDVVVTGRREERVAELRERYGVDATQSNTEAVAGAAIVVIAVKPQDFSALLGEIGPAVSTGRPSSLSQRRSRPRRSRSASPTVCRSLRAMPNAPSTVHEGIAGLAAGAHAGDEHLQLAEDVLSHLGRVVRLPSRRWTPLRRCPAPARRTSRSSRRR